MFKTRTKYLALIIQIFKHWKSGKKNIKMRKKKVIFATNRQKKGLQQWQRKSEIDRLNMFMK